MKTPILVASIALLISSCTTTRLLLGNGNNVANDDAYGYTGDSKDAIPDATYGYTEKTPILVGGGINGPMNEQSFLNSLTGPNGETVTYSRTGSCCSFKTPKSPFGIGRLDIYSVSYEGKRESVDMYFNMYESAKVAAPIGFKLKP